MTRRPIPGFKCTSRPAIPLRGNVSSNSDNRAYASLCMRVCVCVYSNRQGGDPRGGSLSGRFPSIVAFQLDDSSFQRPKRRRIRTLRDRARLRNPLPPPSAHVREEGRRRFVSGAGTSRDWTREIR